MAQLETECDINYEVNPVVSDLDMNKLFSAAWPNHTPTDFVPVLARSLTYICAYSNGRLVGFVNVAWDGGVHAFLLDTTVHPEYQRRGIGRRLVEIAVRESRSRGAVWLHVDYEPHHRPFYEACEFSPTAAGLINLSNSDASR